MADSPFPSVPEPSPELLTRIATKHMLVRGTLETRKSGDLDFKECAVWCVREALIEAYMAGAEYALRTKQ